MIKILDSFTADKIAAGEVIERPLSIVKELIENSIDADATAITIEIRNGGKSYIRITDNGAGIPADEVELAFERHATSKIGELADLGAIKTLGFRGEALASIAAVSRLTVYTRTKNQPTAKKLVIHGGCKISDEAVGANKGTTIITEDVFYNTPARRKFMRTDGAESSAIIALLQKFAIKYAEISFKMISSGRTIFSTHGNGNVRDTIKSIYPQKDFSELIEVKGEGVYGFVSNPGITRNTRSGQIFFVNGRIVSSPVIERGIAEGYGDRIFSGFPIAILFIEADPSEIDVNIHPNKKEIKFLNREDVIKRISDTIKSISKVKEAIPSGANYSGFSTKNRNEDTRSLNSTEDANKYKYYVNYEKSPEATGTDTLHLREKQLDIKSFLRKKSESRPDVMLNEYKDTTSGHTMRKSETTAGICDDIAVDEPVLRPFSLSDISVKGYVFDTYIITQCGDELFILDQHAAHERILYERLIKGYNEKNHIPQRILVPYTIETSADIYNSDRKWVSELIRIGYDISDFGNMIFIIRGIPEYMDAGESKIFVEQFIDAVSEDELSLRTANNSTVINKLIMRSCKGAVKANDSLSDMEISELIDELAQCINPFSCPHGRPTFIKITKYDVEKAFRRK